MAIVECVGKIAKNVEKELQNNGHEPKAAVSIAYKAIENALESVPIEMKGFLLACLTDLFKEHPEAVQAVTTLKDTNTW